MALSPSAHVDTFARDHLPPASTWPVIEHVLPELRYPERLNAASVLLDDTVARLGADRIALRTPGGGAWTYGELQRRVDQIAQVLTEDHGIVPGNRVMLRMPNNPWAVATWLAVVKAGAIAVTTMVAWRESELSRVIARTRPSLLVVDHRSTDDLGSLAPDLVQAVVVGGAEDELIRASEGKSGAFAAVQTAADDVALLGPTSGTTGVPKVTMHFHRDILAIADTFARHTLGLREDDVCAGSPPLAFTFGLGGLVVFPLRAGASSVLHERPNPAALADTIDALGVTVLYTAPTGYRAMLKDGRADSLRALRIGVSAGEHLPAETFAAVERASGLRLVNGIGATELLHVFISAAGDEIRPGATGRPVPGYRATILGPDGQELPAGEPGRLAVIGPTGCRYLDDRRQADYVQHGWNITGDTYVRDEEGYFFYQSRSDDMIVAAGYNIGAPEVESAVDGHPEVLESAVVGRPDPDKGIIVNAFVVLRDRDRADDATRASIQAHVRGLLALYKVPRRVDFVDALPRNASGKLQRYVLRERAASESRSLTVPEEEPV